MPYELLKNELLGLSDDKIMVLVEFARFLKQSVASAPELGKPNKMTSTTAKRQLGSMASDFISIAPDFDTCLEGMEDYV